MSKEIKKYEGFIAYPGNFEGKVCLDYKKIKSGEILVTKATTPAQIEAMTKAIGILVERKGFIQHATIIAREFKIPTIVGIENIT
ncbi:MAG: PEP-utilizing enzyme, partial [Candidatus Nanoarchaeia archaeon]|nr:PEP-utilizing enzyme [Candidatus Nanoarchaeia archaeon]